MATTVRKQAPRPARPAGRYWKGKAPKDAGDLSSSSDESDDEEQAPQEDGDVAFAGEQEFFHAENDEEQEEKGEQGREMGHRTGKMNLALKNVNISKEGKVTIAGKDEVGRTEMEDDYLGLEETEEETDAKAASEGGPDESTEYETESEEEKPKVQFRPVFVPKRSRVTVAEKQALAEDFEEALRRKELETEERKKQSHDLVAESIRRELLEKEKEEEVIDVDDTDGNDPSGEFDAWRLRELARIKRDKEVEIAREEEREEVERRRALPEEQRLKEDLEHAKKSREEKPKGKQIFLQKYWHKGAFHQDQEILKRHDFTEATESTVDVSLLPSVMQVKNFGKRGRTKYTHLVDQDTTKGNGGFGGTGPIKAGGTDVDGGGCFLCGGQHMKKDCPQNTGPSSGKPGTGPNALPTSIRDERRSWRDDDGRQPREARDNYRGWERKGAKDDSHRHDRYRPRSAERDIRGRHRDQSRSARDDEHIESRSPKRGLKYDDDRRWRERRRPGSRSVDARNGGDEKRRRAMKMGEPVVLSTPPRRCVKVAVVGSGLAGLAAAYLLSTVRQRVDVQHKHGPIEYEVHIFEKAEALGMDSHSVSLTLPGEVGEWRVDVPMRSFQGGYYPQLIALYTSLGVLFRRSNFSYSFSSLDTLPSQRAGHSEKGTVQPATLALHPTLIYGGDSGRAGISVPSALKQVYTALPHYTLRRVRARLAMYLTFALSMISLALIFIRLQLLASPWLRGSNAKDLTWGEWTEQMTPRGPLARIVGLDARWGAFMQDVCLPLFSAVCTAPWSDVQDHPVEEFLDFIWRTSMTPHYVVSLGVRDVVGRLSSQIPVSHVHVGKPTTALLPDPDHPGQVTIACGAGEELALYTGFEHVILATQANHAAPLVDAYSRALEQKAPKAAACAAELSECLSRFEYRQTVVINHTDDSLLPADHRDRRDLNLVMLSSSHAQAHEKFTSEKPSGLLLPPTYAMTTHILPRPPGRKPGTTILQTTNPTIAPRPGSVLSVARLERALLTAVGALQGTARRELGGSATGLWVVGSYAHRGIPLLEGCVASAREVVERGVLKCEGGVDETSHA
ncbi:splicing factor, Prp19-binding domain-containing protein [Multifurca ochricompacta]|uniref:Splicing factor, Prp19-binding domain-containing protein n=1 Tax=Multifurca ochricompacta TaxID=376703 RepID=A0AAD4MCC0_9AGAM|nr:splicing factor, Prp19-binding domain-containing protein [Multifurca ochricompacta]